VIPTPATNRAKDDDGALEERADGRRLRAEHNRDAVVQAVLSIVEEQQGGPFPGAAQVAERAGVSERTVFRHFADLDSLFLAAAAHLSPVLATYLAPTPDSPELEQRVAAIVKLRARLYEQIAPVRRVAALLAVSHPVMAETLSEAFRASREQISAVFGPELGRAGRAKGVLLDELDLVLSWPSWESLRARQGCSVDRSRKIVSALLTAVLSPHEASQ